MISAYLLECGACGLPLLIYVNDDRVTVKTVAPSGDVTLVEAKKLGPLSAPTNNT